MLFHMQVTILVPGAEENRKQFRVGFGGVLVFPFNNCYLFFFFLSLKLI